MTIIATLIVLGVLIFVHELGHFMAARSVGIRVDRFSIGLGPRVWGFRRGDTEYVLSAIPLGGYVKMGGMDDQVMERIEGGAVAEEEDGAAGEGKVQPGRGSADASRTEAVPSAAGRRRDSDFDSKPVWARAWVISAGVIMNMIFAFFAYTAVAAGWGSAQADTTRLGQVVVSFLPEGTEELEGVPEGAHFTRIGDRAVEHWGEVREAILDAPAGPLTFQWDNPRGEITVPMPADAEERRRVVMGLRYWVEPELIFVEPGAPAHRAGVRAGDVVVAVAGERVHLWSQVQDLIRASPGREMEVVVARNGEELSFSVTPSSVDGITPDGEPQTIGQIGVQAQNPPITYTRVAPLEAVQVGWSETVFVTGFILNFLGDLVTGQVSTRNLGSIVTIGEASGQAAAEGLPVFLSFMALFSINLAILNLLPIPILDGGHLVFLGIEAIRGRPVSAEQRMRWSQVGFFILLGIMALALGNDFLRLFGL
ncbi:MAG: RIP metalloprotease RseP [Gemmatimonadales bacterium]|nr:MAG: RIP metalloprotease RseP [Gemmatimonadales bacterium]